MMETKTYSGFEFSLISKAEYISVFYNRQLELAFCVAEVEYIPIENFKAFFASVSGLMETFPMRHLLFDKRNLRTFHQPSMEWYFAVWKPSMKAKGLVNHYKILPDLEWFAQAVNAGKHEIFKKYTKDILNGIRIFYVDSVESAIEQSQTINAEQ